VDFAQYLNQGVYHLEYAVKKGIGSKEIYIIAGQQAEGNICFCDSYIKRIKSS